MVEVSNRTLALMLVAALVISLGGTMVSLNKLSTLKTTSLTGFGVSNTSLGNVSLQITDVTWVNFTYTRCNFGAGYVLRSVCTMNSSPYENASGCSPDWTPDVGCNGALEIRNVGNNNVTLNISWAKAGVNFTGAGGQLYYKMGNGTRARVSHGCRRPMSNVAWTAVTHDTQNEEVCADFAYDPAGRDVSMHVQVTIPSGVTVGYKSNRVTAIGEALV